MFLPMRNDVHFAALGAAARVAFGVAVLGGCSGAVDEKSEEAYAGESAVNAKEPCHRDAGPAPDAKQSCDQVLASAFPDAGGWVSPSDPQPAVSDDVKACCTEQLLSTQETWELKYRWQCCGVLDSWNNPNQQIAMACTPWGPPVPPPMKRRRTMAAMHGVA
jgi:hypothetical protein